MGEQQGAQNAQSAGGGHSAMEAWVAPTRPAWNTAARVVTPNANGRLTQWCDLPAAQDELRPVDQVQSVVYLHGTFKVQDPPTVHPSPTW